LNDKSEDEREGRRLFYCCPFHIFASKSVHLPFADGWVWGMRMIRYLLAPFILPIWGAIGFFYVFRQIDEEEAAEMFSSVPSLVLGEENMARLRHLTQRRS